MKILILSHNIPHQSNGNGGYCGGGWISSLVYHLSKINDIQLGVGYITEHNSMNYEHEGVNFYPIYKEPKRGLEKIYYYWRGGNFDVFNDTVIIKVLEIIAKFNPDIVHLFGTESELPYIVGKTSVPCVIHLQGILSALKYSYFPMAIGVRTLMLPTNIREFWLRNGFVFNFKRMKLAAERELIHIRQCGNFIGRTDWDRNIIKMYNSDANYFHVDELLRLPFYEAKKWTYNDNGKNIIVSTLSPTIYKGIDVVLKTAEVLKGCGCEFEWNVVGCSNEDQVVKIIEKTIDIRGVNVNVKFRGTHTAEELVDILLQATMYIHPSYCDNSPNSLAEAQFLGVPIIASNIGGIPTLMNNSVDWLVSPTDIHTLVMKIIELQKLLKEGNYKNNLYPIAIERYNPNRIIKELLSTYRSMLSPSTK